MNNIDLKDLRDKVVGNMALAEKRKEEVKQSVARLKEVIGTISDSSLQLLEQNGIFIGFLKDIDFDRIGVDKEYTITIQSKCKEIAMAIAELVGSVVNE